MTTLPAAGPVPGGVLSRDILEAARRGASRALRTGCADDVEDAAASALAKLAAPGGMPGKIGRPAAFAAACGRNAAIDGRRRALRDRALHARLASAARSLPPPDALVPPPGWRPQEVGPQARDALAAARRALRRSPSPSLRTAATALARLLGGLPLPDHDGDADRRRFDRGVARLAGLMRDRP